VIDRIRLVTSRIETDGRSGLNYEITRLRTLDTLYTSFDTFLYDDIPYFTGRTRPVIIQHAGREYHLGVYKVYVPRMRFVNSTGLEHFVPLKFPNSLKRHPHHKAYKNNGHPLLNDPGTCWGSFGMIISGILADADIPEYFRQVGIYLGRYNPSSPLISGGINGVDFDTREPWLERETVSHEVRFSPAGMAS
jgi:hypothetical protein